MLPRFSLLFATFLAVFPPLFYFSWLNNVTFLEKPNLDQNAFNEDNAVLQSDQAEIKTFKIEISDNSVSDMKARLSASRVTPCSDENCVFMKNLLDVLKNYDWKQHQHFLNTFKQYKTTIEGHSVHFVRTSISPPKNSQVVPLLLLHGFPGSYWDFFKIIPILSNPVRFGYDFGVKKTILFDVIVPSLPGFIFSRNENTKGLHAADLARIISKLMDRLDVKDYFIHGTERLGTDIASVIASAYPEKVKGLHVSNPLIYPWWDAKVASKLLISSFTKDTTSMLHYYNNPRIVVDKNVGAITYALSDSPIGLAAFLMEKWRLYSTKDEKTQLNELFTIDELATTVSLYWLTDTVSSALDTVKITYGRNWNMYRAQVSVPVAICQSPDAPWTLPEHVLRHQYLNITQMTQLPKGGLFHHLQQPDGVAADIFRFVEQMLL